MCQLPENAELYLDSNRGVYIPQNFVEITKPECINNLNDEDRTILLAGPDHEWYWETWEQVLNNCTVTNPDTKQKFTLYQDDDLWLIPIDAEWPEFES